jgi:hypothetical protein
MAVVEGDRTEAQRMGTNLAMKTKKTMKHGYKISPQTNFSCLPFLLEKKHNQNTKQKHSLLVPQTREDNHSITLKVRRQNTSESNDGKKQKTF